MFTWISFIVCIQVSFVAIYTGQSCSPGFRLLFVFWLALWQSKWDSFVHLDFVYCLYSGSLCCNLPGTELFTWISFIVCIQVSFVAV